MLRFIDWFTRCTDNLCFMHGCLKNEIFDIHKQVFLPRLYINCLLLNTLQVLLALSLETCQHEFCTYVFNGIGK
jgi:hypothetical protein